MALFGVYGGVSGLLFYRDASDVGMAYSMGAVGLAGLLGMTAAWCRVLISNGVYRRSGLLFYATVAGLVIGIATAIVFFRRMWMAAPELPFWIASCVVVLGLGLLGATLGARMRTQDAPPTEGTARRDS